jgi:MFS family permease
MPIPTRLANDGWWLCLPPSSSIDAAPFPANSGQDPMKSISLTAFPMPVWSCSLPRKLAVAAGATALADWLFYDHTIGISLALFLLVLAGLSLLANRLRAGRREALVAVAILIAGVAPIVEALTPLSVLFGILAVAVAVSTLTTPFIGGWRDRFKAVRTLLLVGPFRLLPDIARSRTWAHSLRSLTVWIVPLLLSAIFFGLFASANPLIEHVLAALDWRSGAHQLSLARLLFWMMMVSVIWPFIHLRWHRKTAPEAGMTQADAALASPADIDRLGSELFGPGAILRSLVLFNLLFAVQTLLDLIYLWGGVALPDGMTYASYAHRGAYPLMLTALLAAGFVLAAVTPGGPAERKPAIRVLVFAWIAQNVILVISSILRLDLYVETYSLTYWRLAALIWMVLVAIGLVLIVARIALNRPNHWLVVANLATLAAVLYICAFINFPGAIATYNVAHSREVSGKGSLVDFQYLVTLGPQALPAIDRYLQHPMRTYNYLGDTNGSQVSTMDRQRDWLVQRHHRELDSWRAWSFRGWRLDRYLDRIGNNLTVPQ